MDWKERCKIECSCGNDIIAFICKETTCSNHNKQPLYCMQCMTNAAHWHQPLVFIRDEIEVYIQKWTSARQSLSTLLGEASKRYDELKPLIKYYEHEMLLVPVNGQPQSGRAIGQLSEKIAVLKNAGEEFKPIFADMEKLLAQTDLNQIKSNDSKLARILATIEQSSFMAELCETTLLDHYYPAIINDNVTPFTDFTTPHRDAYLRLRFRAENRRQAMRSTGQVSEVQNPQELRE